MASDQIHHAVVKTDDPIAPLAWRDVPIGLKESMPRPFRHLADTPSGTYRVVPQFDPGAAFGGYTVVFENSGRLRRGPAAKYLGDSPDLDAAKAIAQAHADHLAKGYHDVSKLALDQFRQHVEQSVRARLEDLRKRRGGAGGPPVQLRGVQRGDGELSRLAGRRKGRKAAALRGLAGEHPVPDRDAGALAPGRDVADAGPGDGGVQPAQQLGYLGLDDRALRGWVACYWPARQRTCERMKIREALCVLRLRREERK